MVCDTIRSNVQIFYKLHQGSVSDEDKDDMYNLLVETIYAQASAGSFGGLGDVASVQVGQDGEETDTDDQNDDGEGETSERGGLSDVPDPDDGESAFEGNRGPILGAAAGFAALFGAGYWYAMGEDEDDTEKNEQTDDSDSD